MAIDPERGRDQLLLQGGFALVILVAWTVGGLFWPRILPYPWLIVEALGEQLTDGPLIDALFNALQAILTGYFLAILVGIPLGLAMGLNGVLEEFFDPYVDAIYAMPYAAIVPALILWFGTGFGVRVVVVFAFAVFPILINTLEGARSIPDRLHELSHSFDAGRLYTVRNVIIPYELPYILSGLRLGSGLAVRGLVVTELIVAVTGFGRIINQWSAAFRLEGVFSVVLVLMALGISFTWVLSQLEDRLIEWDTSEIE